MLGDFEGLLELETEALGLLLGLTEGLTDGLTLGLILAEGDTDGDELPKEGLAEELELGE